MTSLLTLYLRKELHKGLPVVAYYRDAEARQLACINPWPSKPDRRFKYVMLNCYRWKAYWLPDLV